MKNKTIKNLIGLSAFVMLFVASHSAHAYIPGVWDPEFRRGTNLADLSNDGIRGYDNNISTITDVGFTTYDQNDNLNTRNNSSNTNTVNNKTTNTTTNKVTTKTVNKSNTSTATDQKTIDDTTMHSLQSVDSNNLGASAGNSGFMPNTFWGWLFIVLLILIIIILFRLIARSGENNNHTAGAH